MIDSVADTVDFAIDSNIDIGVGFDTLQSKARGECVEVNESKQIVNVTGQEVIFSLKQIEDSLSLNKHLQISASASLKAATFNVSGKANFSQSVKVNSYSIYVLASVFVRNNAYRMRNVKLKPDTYDLYAKNQERFRNRCGDNFISGYITGGEFHSIIEIKTNNQANKRSLSAELSGSYGIFSGSAAFKQKLEQIAKKNQIHVYVMHTGGTGEIINITPEKMVQQATEFPKTVESDKARPILATIQSYDTLKLPDGITPLDKSTQQEVILELAGLNNYAQKQLANINYILFHTNEFKNTDIQSLNQAANLTRKFLNTVRNTARNCYSNINACNLPTSLELPTITFPERYTSVIEACRNPIYKEKADPICGIKLYKKGTGISCGVKLYRLAKNKFCGFNGDLTCIDNENVVMIMRSMSEIQPEKFKLFVKNSCVEIRKNYETYEYTFGIDGLCIHCIERSKCRHSINGVEKYKTCRNAIFGIEKYNRCRKPQFGFERCAD